MRNRRKASAASVDLIGFLDLLSAVMVIILLVICVLCLSLGLSRSTKPPRVVADAELATETTPQAEERPAPRIELSTAGGRRINTATSFLLCRAGQLERQDPVSNTVLQRWKLGEISNYAIAESIDTPNVYMAVASSCFLDVDGLVDAMRATGLQVGYEPMAEDGLTPWQ